jgi:hypothetical protein
MDLGDGTGGRSLRPWGARALAASLALAVACTRPALDASRTDSLPAPSGSLGIAPAPPEGVCEYDVTVVRPTALLEVSAHCSGFRVSGFVADGALAPYTTDVRGERGEPLPQVGARWSFEPASDVRVRYRVDLDRAADEKDDFDVALAIGRSLLAPASSYLLAPEPAPAAVSILVRVHPGAGAAFATGLTRSGDGFALRAHELGSATYGVFGNFEKDTVELGCVRAGAVSKIDVVSLDGAFAEPRAGRVRWVRKTAEAVASYYGGFPVEHAMIALVPIPERASVLSGKVLPAGGSAVVVRVGADAPRAALDGDWILVHELFHLGFPSFVGEGTWLDEGLATYTEPLIRARAGLLTEEQAWSEVTRDMQRGVNLCETAGLEHPGGDFRAVYWGGAVVALLADAEARRRTGGRRGVEDGLRQVLAEGGDATRVWPLGRALDVIDAALGSSVLRPLSERYAGHGSPVPLDAVLADVGVLRTDAGVRLVSDAPLATARHTITYGVALD